MLNSDEIHWPNDKDNGSKTWISLNSFQKLIDEIGYKAKYDQQYRSHIINKDFNKGVLSTLQDLQTALEIDKTMRKDR